MIPPGPQLDPLTMPMLGAGAAPPAFAVGSKVAGNGRLLHAQRMTSVLRGVVEAFGVGGAELCLLDDATAELRVAADYGDQEASRPRPLESARADLVALAGEAVVLEDAEQVAEWGVARRCRAAVCVPVASDTTIHGTLWLYANLPRAFDENELLLIEIAAGRLAVEVERRRLLDAEATFVTPPAAAAPQLPTPNTPTQLGEIEVAGYSAAEGRHTALHDWLTLADGRLLLVAGAVVDTPGGSPSDAVLAAQAARVASRCYAESRGADAGGVLTRVARAVWQATPGGEGLSLAVAVVDPDECAGSYSLAGGAVAMSVRASRTTAEATEAPPAGWDRDECYASHPFELTLRERLVFSVIDPRRATPAAVEGLADAYRGLPAEAHRRMTAWAAASRLGDHADSSLATVAIRWN
ncbi:MAG: GAF domain-containing protein [Planctomycetota bacterium]